MKNTSSRITRDSWLFSALACPPRIKLALKRKGQDSHNGYFRPILLDLLMTLRLILFIIDRFPPNREKQLGSQE